MKALTIHQPFADLIASGAKATENRTWPTTYRGPLAIHAARTSHYLDRDELKQYKTGVIVAVATLRDCRRLEDLDEPLASHRHAEGPWCWCVDRVLRLVDPVPCRGAQGLWKLPPDVLDQLELAIERSAIESIM